MMIEQTRVRCIETSEGVHGAGGRFYLNSELSGRMAMRREEHKHFWLGVDSEEVDTEEERD
jgi:hypothetical protein